MLALRVSINGNRLCVAGIGEHGVLNAMVNQFTGPSQSHSHLRVGGLDSTTENHLDWAGQVALNMGDKVLIEIIETLEVDKPQVREQSIVSKLAESAQRVLHFSVGEGQRYGKGDAVETEHLLLGILREPLDWFDRLRIPNIGLIRQQVKERVGQIEPRAGDLPLSDNATKVLQLAHSEATAMSEKLVGAEHLLIGLLCDEEGLAGKLLRSAGVDLQQVRSEIAEMRAKAKRG